MIKPGLILILALCFGTQIFAQHQSIKWAPFKLTPAPLPSALQFGYERAISNQSSLGITSKFFLPLGLRDISIDFTPAPGENEGAKGSLREGNFRGIVITPELRYYTSKKKGAGRGFYLNPFLRYFSYGIKGDFLYEPISGEANSTIDASLNFSGFGGGLGLGVQKVWDSGFLIDWNVGLGLSLGGGKVSGTIEGPLSSDVSQFTDDLGEALSDYPFVSISFDQDGNDLDARARNIPGAILKTQLAIGYAF